MGRSVYADQSTEAYLKNLLQKNQWYVGLILGQLTQQRDYVLRLARTPDPAEDEACEESEDSGMQSSKELKEPSPRPASLSDAEDKWVATHAKQVTRMLPGGLNVIGIFAIAPAKMLKDSQGKLRELAFAAQRAVTKNMPALPADSIGDRIILQVDKISSKILCSSIDVSDLKSTMRPAEWKYQSFPTRWIRLDACISIDQSFSVPAETKHMPLLKEIQQAISPFCKDIWRSTAMVNGEIRDFHELLIGEDAKKKGKGRDADHCPRESFKVDFMMPLSGSDNILDPKVIEAKELVSVRGIIVCRAFVNRKSSVQDGLEAIKTDVVRNLCARCELLCEDIEVVGELTETRQLFDAPVRVFAPVAESGVDLCDYMFQDEKTEEVLERIKELTDVDVETDKLELDCERPARDSDWDKISSSEYNLSSLQEDCKTGTKQSRFCFILGAVLSGTIAVAAAAMSFYLTQEAT
ncbi:hypothetical protein C0Q70_17737 [Pomacea canaliculata]|uniref:Protein odr-4 homolog n=1 Tax=Pomacea canaliculata TaxID=400727 RepID=A0A2T7NL92_POMCA|nr:protein odr-4 homolog [Pomacea canaliculata]PVD21934.1 hypothetical protein C0Q70_17737 [Pomacea canaliculata]